VGAHQRLTLVPRTICLVDQVGRLKMQDWKMRNQESMESQPTRLLLIVVVVSDYQHGLCELKL